MNITKYIILFVFLFISSYAFAQTDDDNYDPANFIENQTIKKDIGTESSNSEVKDVNSEKSSKISYNIELGSSVATNSVYGTSMNFYTAPQINYNFTPKLQLSTGFLIINSTMPVNYLNENTSSGVTNFTRSYFLNKISYQASEKLRISGEILYGMNKNPYGLSQNGNKNEYVISFDAEYKINENFKVGIQLSGHNLNSPYAYSNSFRPLNSNYNSPFGF